MRPPPTIHGRIPHARLAMLQPIFDTIRDLRDATLWALGEGHPIDVVPMDEYTHDVCVTLPDGLVVVFDST